MPSTCTFEFDRPEPVYYSGETVNGRIVLQTTSQKTVRDVSIYFEGLGRTYWTKTKTFEKDGRTQTTTEQFRGDECYISIKTFLMGEGVLPPGIHVYTFCIPLPPDCPTSCVEKYGRIYYEIKFKLIRPYQFDNVFVQPLTVLHQNNLNLNLEYLTPLKSEDIKYFCCWPCTSGPVISTLIIPYSGYAPGQDISFKLEIDNQSTGYDMESINVKLIQMITFVAHYPYEDTREYTTDLADVRLGDHCLRLSKRIFEGKLRIPAVPPTSPGNGIIQVTYEVRVEIGQSGCCSFNPELVVPMTIGTVPLWQSATQPESVQYIEPTAPDTPDGAPRFPPSYDICKPPSFENAIGSCDPECVDPDVDPTIPRQIGWVPRYPMYTNFAPPPSSYQNGAQSQFDTEQNKFNESRPLLNTVTQAPSASQGNTVTPYPNMNFMPGMQPSKQ